MRHAEIALNQTILNRKNSPKLLEVMKFIEVDNLTDEKGVAPVLKFTLQSDPVGDVGVNGCQVTDIIDFARQMLISLNDSFPCEENKDSIKCLSDALYHQDERTADRTERGVEGKHEA